ncbi:hypothetical protein B0A48_18610 [Cryoendolithus antarcticus]|uniref:MICOS complex subunit MIC60 n=1 Tax=Cryoendolithus antarcticus TaxID=1507870 RepID=A0A1V8S8U1_9PEZI|nr:hypothetical protein B0A48_18610 [Cryoendolithus antarcticus]
MLRNVARGARSSQRCLQYSVRSQWQPQRVAVVNTARTFAERRGLDKTVLPGSLSESTVGVPQPPILDPIPISGIPKTDEVPLSAIPPIPPTPQEANAFVASTPKPVAPTPPVGIDAGRPAPPPAPITATPLPTASPPPPPPPPPPPKPRHRFRNFLLSLVILSTLGYGGGVFYSLKSDNFHDFFTEYVPYGEDSVAYFEDREFRKRFPSHAYEAKNYPQTRGEAKVTIGKNAGLSAKVAAVEKDAGSDLGSKGRHSSAVEEEGKEVAKQTPSVATKEEKSNVVEGAKKGAPAAPAPKTEVKPIATAPAPAARAPVEAKPAAALVDHINVAESTEPAVQQVVKVINNIITAVNASPEASKFSSVIASSKTDLSNAIAAITTLKQTAEHEATTKIETAHSEFDTAAKELVRRLEQEMREQETKWREEYESERAALSDSYQKKLDAELDAVQKVADEKRKAALLEQEIALQKSFTDSVQKSIETERDGRLSKIDALSTSVSELEDLTSQWNSVVDATQQTQHLHVALEAIRNAVLNSEHPTPFTNELIALKELAPSNPLVSAAISAIPPSAYQKGVPSPAQLIDRFRRVATEVRKASLLPEDAGVASHAASAVLSRLMFAKKSERGLPEGDDVESTLARTEVLLEEGDLESAAREMNGLKGWAGVLSRDWVAEMRRVLEVRQAVDVIATEARLQSLLVQ